MSSQPEPTPPGTFWSKLSARQKKLFAIFSAFGLLVSTAGAFSKTRNWILGFTDEKKIAAAIDKMESDTATQAWQKALSKLDGAADDSKDYRQAVAGLSSVLRSRTQLPYSDKENVVEPCQLEANLVKANPQVIDEALQVLARLSDRVNEAVTLDSADLRGVRISALSVGTLHSRGSCLRDAKLPNLRARVADFSESNLEGTDLTGSVIGYARFNGAVARGVRMGSVIVDSATFYGTDLTGAIFARASFPLTQFTNAKLSSAILDHACLYGSSFGGAQVDSVQLWDSDVVYDKAYLGNVAGSAPDAFLAFAQRMGATVQVLSRSEQATLRNTARANFASAAPTPTCRRAAK